MSEMQHFTHFSYVSGGIRCDLNLDRFSKQFSDAQQWLGDRVLEDCTPLVPIGETGITRSLGHTENGGARVVWSAIQSRFLYMGLVMIDPDTGSPWARKGVKKVVTNKPLDFSQPGVSARWFDEAKARNKEYWVNGATRIAKGG